MAYQTVFKRYELKYLLTPRQAERIMQYMKPYMAPDPYGQTTIRNLYFDTPDYRLIRHSIDRPIYKEKLRIRSYQRAGPTDTVFVELKKKYDHVVYKRRLSLPQQQAMDWVAGQIPCPKPCQIGQEIDYVLKYYRDLSPKVFLSYDRQAYFSREGDGFRITMDRNILMRQHDLSLTLEAYGNPILPPDRILMELKVAGGIPLWMTHLLTEEQIHKTSFSKYGTAYTHFILPQLQQHNEKELQYHA